MVAFELGQKAFHRHGQQLEPTELRHVAKDGRAVETLLFDRLPHLTNDLRRNFFIDVLGGFVFPQQLPGAVHRAVTDALVVARKVQRELHRGVKTLCIRGLLHAPIAILRQQQ